ncbi:MAG: hypothetical protein IJK62_05065 [Bacteroidales bacterium]|nr:hypothetical protein [Bacteroidales bacterium]
MRKFFLLLLFAILCGQHLVYGQRGFDSLPEPNIHIKFGDPIRFNTIEGAELYEFIFSKVVDFDAIQTSGSYICDTIQTQSSYIGVYDYGRVLQLFEPYNIVMRYYTNGEWLLSTEEAMVTLYTDSGTDRMIHDMVKAGHMPKTLSMMSLQRGSIPDDMLIEIPVVYHVVVPSWFNGDPREYISPADVCQNINILNNVFSGLTGEFAIDTRIRFRLATTAPIEYCGQNYYGITYNTISGENNFNLDNDNLASPISYPIDLAYRGTYHATEEENMHLSEYYNLFPSNQYVNIWIFDRIEYERESVYGLTTSPSLSEGAYPILTIIKDVVRENVNLPSRELGYTVAHEMGHLFGLLHAWMELIETGYATPHGIEIVIDTLVDGIDDTRDELGPVLDCDYSNLDQIPYDNIMSYTPDGCRYRFTPLQISHMRDMIASFFPYGPINETEYHIPSMMGVRFEAPEENWFCSSNSFDIRIHAQPTDRNYIRNFEIEGVEDFNPTFTIEDNDNTRIYHIQLSQPLPEGYYNFILHCGEEDDCVSISKQYFVVDCDNNILDKDNAQWYFDTKVTLDFRNGIAQLGEFSAMDANDSESGICDEVQGEILFYTDGNNIWNSNHELIDEGDEEIVNRGTIVLRLNETKYAVVSLNDNGQLASRLIELNPETHATNITPMLPYQETLYAGITAVPCPTGGYWIISAKQYGNGLDIVSLKITLNGNSIVYESGDHKYLDNNSYVDRKAVVMKASPEGKYIVCALAEIGLHIFYFNATYGTFSPIDCQGEIGGKRPSLAFSPSGRFLYVSDMLTIKQYDMEGDYSCNCTGLHSSIVFEREVEAGEDFMRVDLNLQEGPDGRIYFSRSSDIFANSRKIGVIMEPDNLVLYNNGETICHINDSIIKYPPQTILRNRENLPNLVDAKDIDTCAASFTICSENCSIETLRIHNFSLSPTITWTFLDMEEHVLFTIDDEIEPDLSNYVARFNNLDAFIIEQSTGCEGSIKRDTVSFNPQLSIVGQDLICLDGRSYTYNVSMEPYSHIASTQWILNGFNGSADYTYGVSDLIITPNVNDHEFTITCNVQGQFCKDTATLEVHADTICSFITEFIQKCHSGQIILTNALSDDLSDYEVNIIIGQNPYPMPLSQEHNSFVFDYMDNNIPDAGGAILLDGIDLEDLNATIVVTNSITHEVVNEIDVLIPSTYVGIEILDLIAPALCDNGVCYLSIAVIGGEFVPSGADDSFIYIGESSNGDMIYHIPVYETNAQLNGYIVRDGVVCKVIKNFPLPYAKRLDTEIIAYQTDICTDVGYSTIIIKVELPIELPSIPNDQMPPQHIPYPTHESLSVSWNDGYETPLVLSQGSTYIACRYIFEPGIYTPTVHYTSLCSETLEPINIQDLSSTIPVPIIHDIPSAYVCNSTETTSINIEMDIYDVAEGYVPYAICNGHIYTTERLPETDTYTITINGLIAGDYIATLYYARSCPIDIPFTIQLVEPEIRDISHTNVCRSGDLAAITIEMGLSYTEDGFPIVEWNDGETTDFELMSSSNTIYVAARNDFGVGTYTATIHYTNDCSITLDPITISLVEEPTIYEIPPTPAYLCDVNETTSIAIEFELDYLEDGFIPRAVWNDGEITYFELLSGTNTTYRTTRDNIGAGTYIADVYYTSRCYTKSESIIIQVFEQPTISSISHTNICSDGDFASITIEMELNYAEDGFPIVVWNDGITTDFELLPGSSTIYTATRNDIVSGLYTAEVHYTSYCSTPLEGPISIAVSDIDVNYNYISENEVGIHLNFDPPLSSYTISITENGITTETTTSQNPYYFVTNINNDIEITTTCGTIPLSFRVSDVAVNLKSEACLESDVDISFEISGGVAPYTATFTSGDYTTTQTFNTSEPNVIHAEIIQGTANNLTVVSANGDTYNIDLGTINNISSIAVLSTGNLGTSYDGGTYIVTSGLTFDHDVTFDGCTIYCTYEDNDDITSTQWTVNGGKTVTFENCTIKAACPDKMWQGIKVKGNRRISPLSVTGNGNVIMSGSYISDAIMALESFSNGVIIANGTTFENNECGIYYNPFRISFIEPLPYVDFLQVISLRSRRLTANAIENCNFLTTRELNDETRYPKAGIYMDNVWGITLKGCKFINEMAWQTVSDPSQKGIGVHSVASSFEIDKNGSTTSTFSGLHYGVYATGDCSNRAIAVLNSDFDNSMFGIYVNENSGAKILNNNIDVMSSSILSSVTNFRTSTQGMYLNTSKSYNVEGNVISGGSTGMYINNSGVDASKIKNNTFSNAVNAIWVTRQNASSDGRRGIQILCNDFISNINDINVKDGSMKLTQGTNSNPTGNRFSTYNPSRYQFKVQLSNSQLGQSYNIGTYTYYQLPVNSNTEFINQLQRSRCIGVTPRNITVLSNNDYCQTRSYTVTGLISEIPSLEVSAAEKEKEYAEKIDGGNTNALLSQISQMSLFNMPPVWNFYKDGYLSDTVFLSLAEKIQYYPAYITSILVQNSPLPSHIYDKVMEKDFSILLKLVLQLCQIGESPRVDAENEIADLKQNILENETLLEYEGHNIDSIASDLENVIKYFEQKGTTDAKERLFRLYISTYNYQMAGKMLTELQSISSAKYGRYADIGWLYLHTISDTVDWKPDLRKNEMLLLSAIADSSYLYSGMAETLYEYAFDTILPKYTPDFENIITPKNLVTEQEPLEINSDLFEIYPNPTSDYVNIRLNADVYTDDVKDYFSNYGTKYGTECLKLNINLYDINSRLLESKNYYIDEEIKLNFKNYISGTYLIEIRNCFDKIVLRKIVKI